MRRFVLLVVVGLASIGAAADSPFVYPPAPVQPLPPPPPTDPAAVPKLNKAQYYVIQSQVEASVKGYPTGLVKVTPEKGPITVRAIFVGGTGQIETKKFDAPYVFLVEATGTGRVEMVQTPKAWKVETDIEVKPLDVDNGTKPIPPPDPPPPDPPPPGPKVDKAFVIVVEDAVPPRTVETAKYLNDPYWVTLKPKNDFRFYLSNAPVAIKNGYVDAVTKAGCGYPATMILDAKDGTVVTKPFKTTDIAVLQNAVKAVTK